MYDSWLETWELPTPSMRAAWEEKETAEQVQESHETDTVIGTYLLGDADLLGLEPSCEDPRMDLTMIIGSLLDGEEPVCNDLSDMTKVSDGETFNATFDVTELVLQCQPDGWLDSDQPVTVDLSDLLQVPASISEEYCQSFEYEEGIGVVTAVSELPVADKRKSARKRKVFEPADDIGWQYSTDDESTCSKKNGSSGSGEKKSKSSQGAALDKGSPEYRMRRDRNNTFVRASREKARRRHQEVEENLGRVVCENKELRSRVETLTREVEILRGLFVSIGAEIPRDVVARINIATQPLPPSNI